MAKNEKDKIGILLFLNGYNEFESDMYHQIAYLFLDQIICDNDVETYIGAIEILGFDSNYINQSIQIDNLVTMFDREKMKLHPASP